jgi:NADP-dependent 3-hydroxy acid dehydrogenase YdfG
MLTRSKLRRRPFAGRVAGRRAARENAAMDSRELTGSVVIVTGASSGIGAATARLLFAAGAHPVLAARRADRLAELSGALGGALAVTADVTDRGDIRRIADAALDRHGRINAIVNNAGASLHFPLDRLDPDDFARALDLNVVSVLAMTQAVLPAIRAQGGGSIVNVSSGTTRLAPPGVGGYAATKAAVNLLTAVMRKELAGEGIAVSLVVPSVTATEFAGGRFLRGGPMPPGMVAHSAEYVGSVILRALRTGEASIDIPHGPEQPRLAEIPAG